MLKARKKQPKDDDSMASQGLDNVRLKAEAILKRVEELHKNISATDKELEYQQQYNAQVLQQRVKEELEKKQRFEELEKREAARESKLRKAELAREIETIRSEFRRLRNLKTSDQTCISRTFMPFGNCMIWEWFPKIDAVLCVGSHGFLGVWKFGEVFNEVSRKDGEFGQWNPTLVDYAEVVRENSTEDPHSIVACCLCRTLDGGIPQDVLDDYDDQLMKNTLSGAPGESTHSGKERRKNENNETETILLFSATRVGRGALTIVTIRKDAELTSSVGLSEEEVRSYRELEKEFRNDPSKATRNMRIDLDQEGLRWVEECTILVERPIAGPGISSCVFLPATNMILIAVQGTVKCFDMQLKSLWNCQVSATFQPGLTKLSKKSTVRKTGIESFRNRGSQAGTQSSIQAQGESFRVTGEKCWVSSMKPIADDSMEVLVGLTTGEVVLLILPRTKGLAFSMDQSTQNRSDNLSLVSETSKVWLQHVEGRKKRRQNTILNREVSTINSYGTPSVEEDSLLDVNVDPSVDQVISTQFGARMVLLGKADSCVTCLAMLKNHAIGIGCEDGQVGVLNPDLDKHAVFFDDSECFGGAAHPVRDLYFINGSTRVIALDAKAVLREFREYRLRSFARCEEKNVRTLVELTKAGEGWKGKYAVLLAEDAWSVWQIEKLG